MNKNQPVERSVLAIIPIRDRSIESPKWSSPASLSTFEIAEAKAINDVVVKYRGNLTEAAKALGIGRATLFRKVKQYFIDPASVRRSPK